MVAIKHKLIKVLAPLFLLVFLALPFGVERGYAEPAPAQTGLCYDQLGGTITKCNTQDKDASGKPLSASNCYVRSGSSGWQPIACTTSVFSQGTTVIKSVPQTGDSSANSCGVKATSAATDNQCGLIEKYFNPFIKLLSIIVGIVVVISIIVGGIQYAGSAGDPQKAAQAKARIFKTVFALIAFIFLYAFLQFIVPGGIR